MYELIMPKVMELLIVLIGVLISTVFGFAVTWIKEKVGEAKFDKYFKIAFKTVEAIEQEFGKLGGDQRKQKVIEHLQHSALAKTLTPEEINILVHAAVFEMKKEVKKAQGYEIEIT